jgi:hypothetical protein
MATGDPPDQVIENVIKGGLHNFSDQEKLEIGQAVADPTDLMEWALQNGVSFDTLRGEWGVDFSKANGDALAQYDFDHNLSLGNLEGLPLHFSSGEIDKIGDFSRGDDGNVTVGQYDLSSLLNNTTGNANAAAVPIEDFSQMVISIWLESLHGRLIILTTATVRPGRRPPRI